MDQALKQRLVGATVLIALAVIILPMLLSGQPDPQNESRRIELPDKPPELSMDKRRFPIGQDSPERPSVVPESMADEAEATHAEKPGSAVIEAVPTQDSRAAAAVADAADAGEAAGSRATPSAESQAVTTGSAASVTRPAKNEPEAPLSGSRGRYLVQVASFSNPASVNKVSEELNRLRLPVLMDNVTTEAGQLHRVRVGPFDSTAQAEAAVERIHGLNLDLEPRLLDLRPDENAPVTDPADPLVRWIVQAGVFTATENADQLVEALRANGFSGYSERVDSGGKTVFKVRIGPVPERQRAEELDALLEQKMGIDGLVMSVD